MTIFHLEQMYMMPDFCVCCCYHRRHTWLPVRSQVPCMLALIVIRCICCYFRSCWRVSWKRCYQWVRRRSAKFSLNFPTLMTGLFLATDLD